MRGDRGSFCSPGACLDLPSRPLAAVSASLVEPACQTPAQLTKKMRDHHDMTCNLQIPNVGNSMGKPTQFLQQINCKGQEKV